MNKLLKVRAFLIELKLRWKAETPDFWKEVHAKGWQMVVAVGSVKVIDQIYTFDMPELLSDTLNAFLTVAVSMIVLSKLAVKDQSALKNPELDNILNIIEKKDENKTSL